MLQDITLTQVKDFLAVAAGASTIGIAVLRFLYKKMFVPAKVKVDEISIGLSQIAAISQHVGPNGGKSLLDAVNRLEKGQNQISENVKMTEAQLAAFIQSSYIAMWQTDKAGNFQRVNTAFEEISGIQNAHILGRHWFSLVIATERDRVRSEWDAAIADQRSFNVECTWHTAYFEEIRVRMIADTMWTSDGKLMGWMGRVERLNRA